MLAEYAEKERVIVCDGLQRQGAMVGLRPWRAARASLSRAAGGLSHHLIRAIIFYYGYGREILTE